MMKLPYNILKLTKTLLSIFQIKVNKYIINFYFGQQILICFSKSLDPDPHRDKRPDPHQMYADP